MKRSFVLRDTTSGKACERTPSLVIALGNFDGVHLAHAEIIKRTVALADELGAEPAIWMFDLHPQTYLTGRVQKLLSTFDERISVAARLGVKYVAYASFEALHSLPFEEFLVLLRDELCCVGAVCGFNYTFGAYGRGKACDVADFFGSHVHVLPPYKIDGEVVSSSAIRSLLTGGRIDKANTFLGRSYSICGEVVGGEQIGRTLGFPTANIVLPKDRILPATGVYLSSVELGGKSYAAIANLGKKPTVCEGDSLSFEAHLLDFSGDLYGKEICVSFLERIRDEKQFSSLSELKDAILRDKEYARSAWGRIGSRS